MEATGTRWETARVEAFSDGVFAIAITLLVLEIGIDPANFDHLWRALADEWPSYLAYVTSFLTVGGVWLAHHRLYSHLRYVDPMLMRLNILVLMAASFLPFPTSLLAEAFDVSTSAERAAVVVYGVTAGLIEALIRWSARWAAAHPELLEGGEAAAAEVAPRTSPWPRCTAWRSSSVCSWCRASPRSATWSSPRAPCSCPARKVDCRSTKGGEALTARWSRAAGRVRAAGLRPPRSRAAWRSRRRAPCVRHA